MKITTLLLIAAQAGFSLAAPSKEIEQRECFQTNCGDPTNHADPINQSDATCNFLPFPDTVEECYHGYCRTKCNHNDPDVPAIDRGENSKGYWCWSKEKHSNKPQACEDKWDCFGLQQCATECDDARACKCDCMQEVTFNATRATYAFINSTDSDRIMDVLFSPDALSKIENLAK